MDVNYTAVPPESFVVFPVPKEILQNLADMLYMHYWYLDGQYLVETAVNLSINSAEVKNDGESYEFFFDDIEFHVIESINEHIRRNPTLSDIDSEDVLMRVWDMVLSASTELVEYWTHTARIHFSLQYMDSEIYVHHADIDTGMVLFRTVPHWTR